MAKKIEMLNDRQEVVHPLTSSDCVIMENGKTLEEVMGDGIATPTVTHEGASFQVGVGDSNIEVVDGDVAGMTLEGQTYQNILPKPTTLIMETDEKEFKINDKIDNNIVLDDNVAEIATIKGQTYVNVVQEESASEYVAIDEELNGQSITTTGKPEGYVKNATLEGLTLVNTIQEPSGADATVLELDADIDAQYATIDNTVQGGIHGAILTGQTLVNLSENLQTITFTLGEWYNNVKLMNNIEKIKRNTYYTVLYRFEHLSGNHESYNELELGIGDKSFNKNLPGARILDKNGGWCKFRFQLTDKLIEESPTYKQLYIRPIRTIVAPVEGESVNYTIRGFAILEGDYITEPIPFNEVFEGMQSVEVPSVKTTGKNLTSLDICYDTFMKTVTGHNNTTFDNGILTLKWTGTVRTATLVNNVFKPNTQYTLSYWCKSNVGSNWQRSMIRIKYTDGTESKLSSDSTSSTEFTQQILISSPNKTVDSIYVELNNVLYINQIQLEEGSTATTYEPYKSSTLTTPSDVVLRKVGDVQDELDLETGKLTQRIGEYILNGTENITKGTDDDGYINTTQFFINGVPRIERSSSNKTISNLFFNEYINGDYEHFYTVQNRVIIFISKSKLESNDVLGFTKWLQANNIIIQQELTTPIVKTVDLSIVDQSNNSLKTIQVQPTLTHITTSSNGLIPFVTIPSQLKYPTIIKPSTQYTLKLKRDVVDSANQLTVNVGGASTSVTSDVMTITTPDTLTSQDIVLTGKNNVISQLQLIEGDVTSVDYPFFEGMLDVKSPKLLATGKNLVAKTKKGAQGSNGNIIDSNRGLASIDLIKIKNGSTYVLSGYPSPSESYAYALFDKNKNYLNMAWGGLLNPIDGVSYVRPFILYNTDMDLSDAYMQLEEGSVATSYEPYKGVTIEQSIDSIPLTSDMFKQGYYDYDKIIKGMSIQQTPLGTDTHSINRRICSKSLIKVKPNSKYKVVGGLYGWFLFFDKNGNNTMKRAGSLGGVITNEFTTDSNTYYVGMVLHKQNYDIEITLSDIPSDLTLQEVTDEIVLRSIGDVKDTLNLTTGEYVQRIGEIAFDGSSDENWGIITSTTSVNNVTTLIGIYGLDNAKPENTNGTTAVANNMVANNYAIKNIFGANHTTEGCTLHIDNGLKTGHLMVRTKMLLTNAQQWKEYLQTNPLVVQYELATPIIKKVNLTNTTKLASYASTTHYDTIVPSNSLVPNIKIPSTVDYNVAIKPSTQYTIRANTTSAMSVNLGGSVGTLANGKVTLTTPSTLAHNSLKLGNGKVKEVMVIEGSEIKDNVPFFNGMKNVQMGGIKLVNIARGATCSGLVTANTNKTQFTYTGDGTGWGYIKFDRALLKPSTEYTIILNIVKNESNVNPSVKVILGNATNDYMDIHDVGLKKIKYISPSKDNFDISYPEMFSIGLRPCTSGKQVVIQNPMIIEGDWTHLDEIPYIESEMIIEQPIIRSQGKNLFHIDGKELYSENNLHQIQNNDVIMENTIYGYYNCEIKYFNLKPNKNYILSYNTEILSGTPYVNAIVLDEQKNTLNNNNGMFTVPSNGKIRIKFYSGSDTKMGKVRYYNIQLEEGSSATTYEPFKQHTLSSNRVIGYEEGVHYGGITGIKSTNPNFNSVLADVEGLSIAYVTNGSSNFSFWDKDMVFISGKSYLDTSLSNDNKNGFIQVPSNAKYMKFASANTTGSPTNYTKATVTGELPLRSLPNGVCDSFNLVTGEYVQRVGEVVLDGSDDENWVDTSKTSNNKYRFGILGFTKGEKNTVVATNISCDSYIVRSAEGTYRENHGMSVDEKGSMFIYDNIYSLLSLDAYKQYLKQNPITIQYELATPIVRKIGLTAKGNYKEIELNGSERMAQNPNLNKKFHIYDLNLANDGQLLTLFTNKEQFTIVNSAVNYTMYKYRNGSELVMTIDENINTVDLFKRWLSQNPIKVGHLTNDSASLYSNIQKPIFFNDVKVQFMNDNVDIQPTLTLQSTSRNSYVMDMMKANTVYTLKALANPNSFTIDGTSYSATTNGAFTSPSTLTNKLLITGLDVYELMIIEGDVTGKQLPYYKGIRSSFDNTDKVEVLSENINLFDINGDINGKYSNVIGNYKNELLDDGGLKANNCTHYHHGRGQILKLKPNTTYTITGTVKNHGAITIHSKTKNNLLYHNYNNTSFVDKYTTKSDETELCFCFVTEGDENKEKAIFYNIQIEESSTATPYQSHEENTTIINMPIQLETVEVIRPVIEVGRLAEDNGQNGDDTNYRRSKNYIPVEPNMNLTFMNGNAYRAENVIFYDINKNYIGWLHTNGSGDLIIPKDCYFIRFYSGSANTSDITVIKKQYKPIALNELPNGVKDELIINRATSSAKLIRRVGKIVLDGSEDWLLNTYHENTTQFVAHNIIKAKNATRQEVICDKLQSVTDFYTIVNDSVWIYNSSKLVIHHSSSTSKQLKDWLKQNPITVYYELAEPVITEIRLKGYPFVYEDGSVQLNTEIPHTTKVKYNVNQEHLINGQNETIIRHDKQIDNLYDYIELYLEEEYRMELFRMQLELSL